MKLRHCKNKNLIRAANKFQPWDYAFLLELEKRSLTIMLEYYSSKIEVVRYYDRSILKYMNIALKLLDIILDADTSLKCNFMGPESERYISIKYVNSRNWHRFFPKDNGWEDAIMKDQLRKEKAWHLYNLIREREMRHWWD